MTSAPYDLIADRFRELRTQIVPKEAQYLALLLASVPAESTILDLGCGTGCPIATYLTSLGHRIVGVDASEVMLAFAREQLPAHRWIHERIEQVQFDESFAAVVCWDSLFHLPRRHFAPVIQNVHRWLAPGGTFMVSSGGTDDGTGEGFTDSMFGHEFYYDSLSPSQMIETIQAAGFDILLSEMCDPPDGLRNKGKWATVAAKKG